MTIDQVRELKNQQPFQRFTIHMADGRNVTVRHPDAIAWDAEHRRVALVLEGGKHHWIEVALITSLEADIPSPSTEGNGAQ